VVHIARPGSPPKRQARHVRRELKDRVALITGVAGLIVPAFGALAGRSFKASNPD
jgi:hypothetical protein